MDKTAIKRKAIETTKEYLVMVVYLWVILGLFAVYRAVILARDVSVLERGIVLINALVLGKIMLIAKELHLGEVYTDRPLIYPTLVKSALFSIVMAFFKLLEETVRGLFKGLSMQQSISDITGGTWLGILCITGILFVALIPFFGFAELQAVFGEAKLRQLFFRSRELGQMATSAPAKKRE
jgi:hypothetical protein